MINLKITLLSIFFSIFIDAQITHQIYQHSNLDNFNNYVDSIHYFTFNYPSDYVSIQNHNEFTIKKNSEYYLFGTVINIKEIITDDFYNIKRFKDTKDLFKEIAIQATVTTQGIRGDRGEAHFRADSIKEFYSVHGLRVIAVFYTIVTYVYDTGGTEEEYADPIFWIDISEHKEDYALRLEFRDYQKKEIKNLSKIIYSSLKLIKHD